MNKLDCTLNVSHVRTSAVSERRKRSAVVRCMNEGGFSSGARRRAKPHFGERPRGSCEAFMQSESAERLGFQLRGYQITEPGQKARPLALRRSAPARHILSEATRQLQRLR
jgi:hypothetical protein